ncbi:hypothetical protein M514_25456 [Trichuris suis]|uniref:Uncharacterized protein n=1 Tax=Trichuris suis TaxID=68888 RepID=A0A085MYN7_9BILA|nr:hypothetical protein M514_25456 [Trichuris suis]
MCEELLKKLKKKADRGLFLYLPANSTVIPEADRRIVSPGNSERTKVDQKAGIPSFSVEWLRMKSGIFTATKKEKMLGRPRSSDSIYSKGIYGKKVSLCIR